LPHSRYVSKRFVEACCCLRKGSQSDRTRLSPRILVIILNVRNKKAIADAFPDLNRPPVDLLAWRTFRVLSQLSLTNRRQAMDLQFRDDARIKSTFVSQSASVDSSRLIDFPRETTACRNSARRGFRNLNRLTSGHDSTLVKFPVPSGPASPRRSSPTRRLITVISPADKCNIVPHRAALMPASV